MYLWSHKQNIAKYKSFIFRGGEAENILPFVDKWMVVHVNNVLDQYLVTNHLLDKNQYGFKASSST